MTTEQIKGALPRVEKHINSTLNLISSRLGLDDSYVIGSPNFLPAIVRFFDKSNVKPNNETLNRILYWYIHSMLWGRYSAAVETVVRQDIIAIDENEDEVGAMIMRLRQTRGHLGIAPLDFAGWTRNNRFYSLLYLLSRVYGTRDLDSGIELRNHLLGKNAQLEMHHIFPKAQLRDHRYEIYKEINAVANFTFLTQDTNRHISAKLPEDYFPEYEAKHPDVLASHWIPTDPALWKIENYRDFLAARRELLAKAANAFLNQLLQGDIPETPVAESIFERAARSRPASIVSDEEADMLNEAMRWMEGNGLPRGEYGYELVYEDDDAVTILDLAWPDGIQVGLSDQTALLIDEEEGTLEIAQRHGFRCFTTLEQLKRYVQREIIGDD